MFWIGSFIHSCSTAYSLAGLVALITALSGPEAWYTLDETSTHCRAIFTKVFWTVFVCCYFKHWLLMIIKTCLKTIKDTFLFLLFILGTSKIKHSSLLWFYFETPSRSVVVFAATVCDLRYSKSFREESVSGSYLRLNTSETVNSPWLFQTQKL